MVPGFALRTAFGEFADEGLLGGQRAIPAALERAGFEFHHNTIGEALAFATAPNEHVARTVADMAMTSIRSATTPIDVRRLGTVDYQQAWQLQREVAEARIAGGPDTLLLLEHPSVYTAGKRTGRRAAHRRPAGGGHRSWRQDHVARSRPTGWLPDLRPRAAAGRRELRTAPRIR